LPVWQRPACPSSSPSPPASRRDAPRARRLPSCWHIGGVLGPALLIDDDREVAAVADGVHGREEDERVAPEQVLDVVFGGGEHDVYACLLHQAVEARLVEGNGGRASRTGHYVHWSVLSQSGLPAL